MSNHLIDWHRTLDGGADEAVIVCGIGESLFSVKRSLSAYVTVGVNDIFRYYRTDFLVLLDRLAKFSDERLSHILAAREHCRAIFTPHVNDIHDHLSGGRAAVVKMDLKIKAPFMKLNVDLDSKDHLHCAITSPFTGISLAAYLGAKRIGVVGVDFTNHELGSKTNLYEVNVDYGCMARACERAGILLLNLSPVSLLEPLQRGTLDDLTTLPLPGSNA